MSSPRSRCCASAAFAGRRRRGRRAERERADALRREGQRLSQARLARGAPVQDRGGASELHRHHRGRPLGLRPAQLPRSRGRAVHHREAAPHHDLRKRRMAADRPHHSELLAQDHRAGARRRQGRDRRATAAAVDPHAGPRRGSAGALSAGRLLARAPAAAGEPEMERLRLVVPGRAGRVRRAAVRRHPRGRVRSERRARSACSSRAAAARPCGSRRSTPTSRCST